MAETKEQVKHTPGPWSFWHDTCAKCREDGTAEFCIDGPPGGSHGQFSSEADARLVAAAPDMLEALKAITELHGEQSSVGHDRERSMNVYCRAQAAIAKAEGTAPNE